MTLLSLSLKIIILQTLWNIGKCCLQIIILNFNKSDIIAFIFNYHHFTNLIWIWVNIDC